MMLYILPFQFY